MNKKVKLICKDLKDLVRVAEEIIKFAEEGKVWLFEGEMGAGKTTLIKSICLAFNIKDNVSSPTYALVNEYHNEEEDVFYHFDFYRIKNEEEALDIGTEDYFYSGDYCFIEWPSKIPSLIPENHLLINILEEKDNSRIIELSMHE